MANNSLHFFLRKLGLGKLFYLSFHAPRAALQKALSRGLLRTLQDSRGHARMRRHAQHLTPLPKSSLPQHEVCFLTGRKHWHQTCFCAYTLQAHSTLPLRFRMFDDGTLTEQQQDTLESIFPWVTLVSALDAEEALVEHLPPQRFPALHARRKEYPHLKKLLDIHCGHRGWRLVLDSDMLFFREPTALLDWLRHPSCPMYMLDCMTSYGYSHELLEELTGHPLPERVNVGICGLQSDTIDWEQVEYWCETMIEREGTHYVQEQALTAMLISSQESMALSEVSYICCPSQSMVERATGSLHHYVAESKSWYYQIGWEKSLEQIKAP